MAWRRSVWAALLLGVACAGHGGKVPLGGDTGTSPTGDSGAPDSPAADDSDDTGPRTDTGETAEDTGDTGAVVDPGPEVTVETADPVLEWAEPCAAYAAAVQTGTVVDTAQDELSGIAVSLRDPNVLWTHEDHAGDPAIYALDPEGNTLATVTLDGATNNDWEDIALGPCGDDVCIFIGEIGNNDLDRTDLGVYMLPEPDLTTITDGALSTTDWTWYGFDYPDGSLNAEALAVTVDGLPVVMTKKYDTPTSEVYVFPSLDPAADTVLTLLGTVATGAAGEALGTALTAASLWPDDSRLIFRTYNTVWEVDLAGGLAAISTAPVVEQVGATELHGEAIAYDPWRGGFWQVAEGVNTPLWYVGCAE